jgi:SAM-dependent methyltransferase
MALPVPPPEMRFMGEDEAGFVRIGDEMVARIGTLVDLTACRRVLDIGCGYGRIGAGFVRSAAFTGRYDGFDLLEPHIAWCNEHLGDRRTKFHYLPIYSERYNPGGTLQQTEVRFDVPDGCADLIVLTSVFTHMYPDDVVHYLHECRRLLSARGRVYATFFMMNDRQGGRPNVYPLPHEHSSFARFMNPEEPLHVIAYTEEWLREQFAAVGLQVEGPIRQGEWSGEPDPFDFQDTVVLSAVGSTATPARRWWRR